MKKVGQFLACFLPLIGFLVIQVAVAAAGSVIKTVSLIAQGVTDAGEMMERMMDSDFLMTVTIISQIVCFIVFLIFYRVIFKIKRPEVPTKVFGALSPILIIVMFVAVEAITGTVLAKLGDFLPELMEEYAEMIESSGLADLSVLSTIATLVMAPLGEELAFRGMTLNLAGKFTKKFWIANIIQAAMFGIAHMNIVQGTYAFVLGLLLGYLYRKFNSLYATIIAHLSFNFAGTYLAGPLFGDEETVATVRLLIILAVAIVLFAASLTGILKDKKTLEREPEYFKRIHFRDEVPVQAAQVYATYDPRIQAQQTTTDPYNNNNGV